MNRCLLMKKLTAIILGLVLSAAAVAGSDRSPFEKPEPENTESKTEQSKLPLPLSAPKTDEVDRYKEPSSWVLFDISVLGVSGSSAIISRHGRGDAFLSDDDLYFYEGRAYRVMIKNDVVTLVFTENGRVAFQGSVSAPMEEGAAIGGPVPPM